jgi:hypothetical protein
MVLFSSTTTDLGKIFYRYGEAMLVGLTFSSLLGGMVSFT